MRETTVEKHLRKQATAAGALVRKLIWPGHRGAPDRLVIWPEEPSWAAGDGLPARVDFVELKAPGKKPDPHQEREHARIRATGCRVFTLDSLEAVDKYVAKRRTN